MISFPRRICRHSFLCGDWLRFARFAPYGCHPCEGRGPDSPPHRNCPRRSGLFVPPTPWIGFVFPRRTIRAFSRNPLSDRHLSSNSPPRKLALFGARGLAVRHSPTPPPRPSLASFCTIAVRPEPRTAHWLRFEESTFRHPGSSILPKFGFVLHDSPPSLSPLRR